MMSSTNPIAIITGGSRGLGKSTALHMAKRGIGVIITYKSQRGEADAVVAAINETGGKAVALQLDVGNSASFEAFASEVKKVLGSVWGSNTFDYLVNNAGIGMYVAFADTSEAQFDELMNVHFKGSYFLSQRLLPLIADGGRIVNLSTGLTRFTFPGYSAYAAMKGAIEVMTRYMAKELGPRGIAVNTVAPGAIETDFAGGGVRDNPEINAGIAASTALGRVGLPDDIGGMIASLVSPDHRWVNAQRVEVSGGHML
jgi:NAD(P)-dependent dehydrogenase (short-subunit alcohol dehydrogenase family)